MLSYNNNLPSCIVCDLDGTISLPIFRSIDDLTKVSEDLPNRQLIRMLRVLNKYYRIIFVSEREATQACYENSFNWLVDNFGPNNDKNTYGWILYMREEGNKEPDIKIKSDIYYDRILPYYNVVTVFDDKHSAVRAWRDIGLFCCQV